MMIRRLFFTIMILFITSCSSTKKNLPDELSQDELKNLNNEQLITKGDEYLTKRSVNWEYVELAEKMYSLVLKRDNNNARAMVGLANVAITKGYYSGGYYDPKAIQESEKLLIKAYSLDPLLMEAYITHISLILKIIRLAPDTAQKLAPALKTLHSRAKSASFAKTKNQVSFSILEIEGLISLTFGDFKMSLKQLEAAKNIAKGYVQERSIYGSLYDYYSTVKNYKMAEAYALAITKKWPLDAWALNNLGLARNLQGKFDQAIPPLLQANKLREFGAAKSNLANAYIGIMIEYAKKRDFESAHAITKQCEKDRNEKCFPSVYNMSGTIYLKLKMYDHALDEFNEALEASQDNLKWEQQNPQAAFMIRLQTAKVLRKTSTNENADYSKIEELLIDALEFAKKTKNEKSLYLANLELGSNYHNWGFYKTNQSASQKALEFYNKALNYKYAKTAYIKKNISKVQVNINKRSKELNQMANDTTFN